MKFFRLDLLTLLISLFILNSCKNQDTIGLNSGSGLLSGSLVDTATVNVQAYPEDSVATNTAALTPVGFLNDPVFGQTESGLITDLNLPGATSGGQAVSYTTPTGQIIIDSALLVLRYAHGFYGDSLSNYTVNVYQLNERQYSGQTYYNNKIWNYNSTNVLGTKTFQPRPLDSIFYTNIVTGGKDTLKKFPPQIRIPINTDFIRSNLFSAGTISNLVFRNNVKGFFINVDKTKTTGVGGTIMLYGDSSTLAVYVRVKNGTVTDTAIVNLPIVQHASQIVHTYTTPILNALKHTTPSDSLIYLQGTAGLRTKVSFPYIKNLFKSLGNINVIINRAELVVTAAPGSDIPAYLSPLPKLTLYRYDIAHQPIEVEDAVNAATFLPGQLYNSTKRNYHFLLTSYIQDLVNGTTTDYGTFIAPADSTSTSTATVSIAPTIQTASRTLAVGANNSSPYRIKLNVIYTKTGK